MMEIDWLATGLHKLGDRFGTELRKYVIIVTVLSADYEIEVRMLANNSAGLESAEIERAVRNRYNRLFRRQHDLKALSASGGTTPADCGEKKRRPRNQFEGNCFNRRRKGHRAEECRRAKKKTEKSGDAPANKKAGGIGESATSNSILVR